VAGKIDEHTDFGRLILVTIHREGDENGGHNLIAKACNGCTNTWRHIP
jgi:hypothetical protein